jgi:hypothetical protein
MGRTTQHNVGGLIVPMRFLLIAAVAVCLLALVATWVVGLPAQAAPVRRGTSVPISPSPVPSIAAISPEPSATRETVAASPEASASGAADEHSSGCLSIESASTVQAGVLDEIPHRLLAVETSVETASEVAANSTSEPPSASELSTCADAMVFVADVTVPDGTAFGPNEGFIKTWRVRNAGTCDWAGYRAVFADGDSMGAVDGPLPDTPAGQEVQVSIEMTSPDRPGDYRGDWQVRSPDGANLGTLTCVITVGGDDEPAAEEPPQEPALIATPASPWKAAEERWINVDLSRQLLTAYEGRTPVRTTLVSTGLPATPTPVGQYRIWVKFRYDDMAGADYYIEDVPYVMYFHGGYGLHGVTWHGNFGQPMSHGCVNLPTSEAEWLFNWADVGTLVNIRE